MTLQQISEEGGGPGPFSSLQGWIRDATKRCSLLLFWWVVWGFCIRSEHQDQKKKERKERWREGRERENIRGKGRGERRHYDTGLWPTKRLGDRAAAGMWPHHSWPLSNTSLYCAGPRVFFSNIYCSTTQSAWLNLPTQLLRSQL